MKTHKTRTLYAHNAIIQMAAYYLRGWGEAELADKLDAYEPPVIDGGPFFMVTDNLEAADGYYHFRATQQQVITVSDHQLTAIMCGFGEKKVAESPTVERCGEIVGFLATRSNGAGEWRRCQNQRPCMEHPRCAICGRRNDAKHDDNDHEWASEFAPPAPSPDTQREESPSAELVVERLTLFADAVGDEVEEQLLRDAAAAIIRLTAPSADEEEGKEGLAAFLAWFEQSDEKGASRKLTALKGWNAHAAYARKRGGR